MPNLFFDRRRLLLVAVAICLVAQGCGRKVGYSAIPRGAVVLAFGDSVTHGTGAGPDEGYPAQLAALSGCDTRH